MEKWFDQDKNYILKQAQYAYIDNALTNMVKIAVDSYLLKNNPLGLVDDFVLQLKDYSHPDTKFLYKPYQLLSGVYRLLHSDNQLTFSWDGKSHFEVFTEEWKEVVAGWMKMMCMNSYLDKIVIKGAILNPYTDHSMLEAHINKIIYHHFPVKKTRTGHLIAA